MKVKSFKSFPKQDELFLLLSERRYKFVMIAGSIRSGKTYFSLGYLILLCYFYPESRHVVVRSSLQRIKDTVLPTFFNIVPNHFLSESPSQHNSWEARFNNGSCIKFYAENIEKDSELKRFRGLEGDTFLLEELDVQYKTFQAAFQRCGTWKMAERKAKIERGEKVCPAIVLATTNPQMSWVKTKIYDKWLKNELNPNWCVFPIKVTDNPNVSKDWLQGQKDNLDALEYQKMIVGDWEADPNNHDTYLFDFDKQKHVTKEPFQVDYNKDLLISFDFNVSPCSVVFIQFDETKGIYIPKILQVEGGTAAMVERLQYENLDMFMGNVQVCGDVSGSSRKSSSNKVDYEIIEDGLQLGAYNYIHTSGANGLHRWSRRFCNTALRLIPFFINPECERLIQEMQTGKWKGSGLLKGARGSGLENDLLDALRYGIHAIFQRDLKLIIQYGEMFKSYKQAA